MCQNNLLLRICIKLSFLVRMNIVLHHFCFVTVCFFVRRYACGIFRVYVVMHMNAIICVCTVYVCINWVCAYVCVH